MPPSYFPLRWESTGDQWWYASPIDWAAANGYYDVVLELLYLDTNLLIKLTSLRRIRRLETVWDDEAQFDDIAQCRSQVARKLFLECETKSGTNSLIRARYGGWLLYTAASAGDMGFVQELLERDPFLVFGEGEYGVSDIFYAAARGKNYEVFMLLFDLSLSPKCLMNSDCGELEEKSGEIPLVFRWEMMNRAVHAVARGGNLEILKELIGDCPDVLVYRDVQGSTILHAASSRGKVEVVEYLVSSFDIITSTDNQGNTALHVAAYQGHLAVVEALILSSPGSTSLTNNSGDTFLHMVVTSFCTPGFRRLDRQIELMKQLVYGKIVNMQDVINMRNNHGRTALHMAVVGNIHSDLVELLMTMPSIDLNIPDVDGMTPLDLLKQRRHSASSEILIKHLISAGGISNCQDHMARSAIVSHLKMQGVGSSPGTTFRIPDAEIFLYSGIETTDGNDDQVNVRLSSCSSKQRHFLENKKLGSARRLKILLWWPKQKGKKSESVEKLGDEDSLRSYNKWGDFEDTPTPLRQRFSKQSSFTNNKRVFSVGNNYPSPSTKKKFALGLMHGVIQPTPHLTASLQSPCSYFSRSSMSSPTSLDKLKGVYNGSKSAADNSTLVNKRLMNQYFCFGAQGLTVDDQVNRPQPHHDYKQSVLTMAQ